MITSREKTIDCSAIKPEACSDSCLTALGHGADFALRADTSDATVHGTVMIIHNYPPLAHEITVEVYEADEAPVTGRESTIKQPDPMPTDQTIKDRIDAWTL
jgi:hypothetical protein